jgi:hypothetical protein
MRIEKIDKWFSRYALRFTQGYSKTVFIGLRVAKRIEKTDIKISASFMMLCLISIVVYGNAD